VTNDPKEKNYIKRFVDENKLAGVIQTPVNMSESGNIGVALSLLDPNRKADDKICLLDCRAFGITRQRERSGTDHATNMIYKKGFTALSPIEITTICQRVFLPETEAKFRERVLRRR
jgi:hypothetical protein